MPALVDRRPNFSKKPDRAGERLRDPQLVVAARSFAGKIGKHSDHSVQFGTELS